MERRYSVLRFIAGTYLVLALLALIGTVLAALTGTPYGIFSTVLVGGGITLSLAATCEVINVFLAIEENTRRQAIAMEKWTPPTP